MKVNLKVPYLYFQTQFLYKENIKLSELETLLCILIYSCEKKEIEKNQQLLEVIKKEYNLNNKLSYVFEEVFQKLLNKKIITDEVGSGFKDCLIGDIKLDKNVVRFLDDEKFIGFDEKNINKTFALGLDILFRENNKNCQNLTDKEMKKYEDASEHLIKISDNIIKDEMDSKISAFGEKNTSENQSFIEKKIINEKEVKELNNIRYLEKDFEFKLINQEILSKDEITDQILNYYFEKKCFQDLDDQITKNLFV